MKIIKLRFHNINSLKNTSEILLDEKPLSESGIFAITGVTGSGKTSILDAISLALYGMAPRCGINTDGIMTYNTAECWSEVEFIAGGILYRSRWSVKRSYNKPNGALQPARMELADVSNNKILEERKSEVPAKVAEITGLEYKQFLRSMLLAQGEFAAFLKANKNERGDLLEKITGTEIYKLVSTKVFEKEKRTREELDKKQVEFDAIQILQPEEEKNITEELNSISQLLAEKTKQLEIEQENLKWAENLEKIQRDISETEERQTKLNLEAEKLKQQILRLEIHQKAIKFKPELTEIEKLRTANIETEKKIYNSKSVEKNLQENFQKTQISIDKEDKQFVKLQESLERTEPIANEIKILDIEINRLQKEFQEISSEFQQKEKEKSELQVQLTSLQEKVNTLQSREQKGVVYLDENKVYEDFSEKIGSLEEVFKNFQNAKTELNSKFLLIKEIDKDIPKIQANINKQIQQKIQIEKEFEKQQKAEAATKSKLAEIVQGNEISFFENSLSEQQKHLPFLIQMFNFSEIYSKNDKRLSSEKEQFNKLSEQLSKTEKEINELNIKLASETELLKILQENYKKAELLKSLESHRKSLKENEECPLCGSTHHPLANYNAAEEENTAKKQWSEKEKTVQNLSKQFEQLSKYLIQTTTEIKQYDKNIFNLEKENINLKEQFDLISSKNNLVFLVTEISKIECKINELKSSIQTTETILKQAKQADKELSEINNKIIEINKEINKNEFNTLQFQNEFSIKENEKSRTENEINKLETEIKKYKNQINTELEACKIEANAETITIKWFAETRKKCDDYKKGQKGIIVIRNEIIQAQGEYNTKEILLNKNTEEFNALHNKVQAQEEKLKLSNEERFVKFGTKNPDEEISKLKSQIQTSRNQIVQYQEESSSIKEKLTTERTIIQQNNEILNENSSNLESIIYSTVEKAQDSGFLSIDEINAGILSEKECNNIQAEKENLEKRTNEQVGIKISQIQEFEKVTKLNKTSDSLEEIRRKTREFSDEIQNLNQKTGSLKQQISANNAKKQASVELRTSLDNLKKEHYKWQVLNDLVGSKDGNKFNNFAQGLSLSYLITKANQRLYKLNPRYKIKRKGENDLDLAIIDCYQANNMRNLNTLSGGETFLVSLALALGLSDLASRNTSIDSMFIDEGFGTLDTETLDTAISALENLQKQGKTIGIISHVDTLKERISTQIQVKKVSMTESKIEIVG